MDVEATYRFVEKYSSKLNVNLELRTLANVMEEFNHNKKPLVIYLHNEFVEFSEDFCNYITQYLVDNTNFLVWDITENSLGCLIKICKLHIDCDLLTDYISNQTAALFVFKFIKGNVELTSFYDGDTCSELIISRIHEEIIPIEAMDTSFTFQYEKKQIMDIDLQNRSLKEALRASGINIEDSVQTAVKTALSSIRPLLIYVHNGEDIFSKLIWPLITNKDVNNLFSFFTVYAWDLSDAEESSNFIEFSKHNRSVRYIVKRVVENMSCLFTFSTIGGNIEMNRIFDGSMSEQEFLFELYNIQMVHSEEKQLKFTLIQKEAIITATSDIKCMFDLDDLQVSYNTIEETVQNILLAEPEYLQKMVVLFYYNEHDIFSRKFIGLLMNKPKLRQVLEDLFVIVPWNVGIEAYGTALKSVVRNNFAIELMEECIDNKCGALFVFTSVKNRPELVYTSLGDCDTEDLINAFFELSVTFQDQRNITDIIEKSVCNNFIECNRSLPKCYLNSISLHTAIQENCLCSPIKKRKMLLLYYHNIANKNCTSFTHNVLKDPEVMRKIQSDYFFIPWDMSVSPFKRDRLCIALKRYFALDKLEMLFKSKKSGLFIFMPIAHTLALFRYVNGEKEMGKSDLLKNLNECSEFLNAEKLSETMLQKFDDEDGPAQFQQLMFDQLGNRDYDCFELQNTDMENLLKKKLSFGLFGPPAAEDENIQKKVKDAQVAKIEDLYSKILEQVSKFAESNKMVVITCIFNCLIPLPKTKVDRLKKDLDYKPNLDFTPVPLFVLRKCVNCPEGKTPCRIFIDHDLRTYQSWDLYLEDNKLPKGIFIVPKDGKYQGDHFGRVRIEYRMSPACNIGKDILKYVDIGSAAVGAAAGVIGLATLIPAITVAPIVAVGAGVTGIGVGIYSLIRSSITLHDRFCHDESMGLGNSQARGAYLNIIAGSFSFTGLGASFMLAYFVRNGATVGMIVRGTVNSINGINVVTSGVAVANSAFEVLYNYVKDDEVPSALTILQLSSSILFFGHAVYSFRSANSIINEAQYRSLQEIEASLRSNRHRKTFTKLKSETIRLNGDVQKGQAEVISYMKELNNKDEVLATLTRTNKDLNNNGIRYSVKDGKINFNGKFVEIGEFSNMSKLQRSEYMLNLPPKQESKPIQYKKVQDMISTQFSSRNFSITTAVMNGIQMLLKIRDLSDLTNMFSFYVQDKIYMYLKLVLEQIFTDIDLKANLLNLFPEAKITVEVLKMILNFFKSNVLEQEQQSAQDGVNEKGFIKRKNITRVVYLMEKAIIFSSLSVEYTLRELIKFAYQWMSREIYELGNELVHRENASTGKNEVKCTVCGGVYFT